MIDNVVLVSSVQQSDSVIHICVSVLFQTLFPFRLLQNIKQSSLCCTVGPFCISVFFPLTLNLVSIKIVHGKNNWNEIKYQNIVSRASWSKIFLMHVYLNYKTTKWFYKWQKLLKLFLLKYSFYITATVQLRSLGFFF